MSSTSTRRTGGTGAAFFDLDKTVIATSSALAFGRPLYHGGLMGRRDVLKAAYAQLAYLIAGADERPDDGGDDRGGDGDVEEQRGRPIGQRLAP